MASHRIFILPLALLFLGIIANFMVWAQVRDVQAKWTNVPPVMSQPAAIVSSLGDRQLAYRMIAMMLQHLGDHGGRVTALRDYDYARLNDWFMLGNALDARSDMLPFLAAHYFGALEEPIVRPILDYLELVGSSPDGQKWRWLSQGVFIAKYHVRDDNLALELAQTLAAVSNPNMPAWTRAMPAFVLTDMGKEEAAFALLLGLLQSDAENLHPNEVVYLTEYICRELIPEGEQAIHPLCQRPQ